MPINVGTRRALLGRTSGYIVSAQQISITIPSTTASATATIQAVNTSRSFLVFGGYKTNTSTRNASVCSPRIELTNSTTVTAYRDSAISANTVTVRLTVLEFNSSFIKSIQSGTISLTAAASNTATISAVSTANSTVVYAGATNTDVTTSQQNYMPRINLTNSTTVTAQVNTASVGTIGYQVVEFQPSVIKKIQEITFTSTANSASETSTISSVVMANTACFWGGYTAASANVEFIDYAQLTSSTSIAYERNTATTTSRTNVTTVVEFNPGVIKSVNRIISTQASVASTNTTIPAVYLNKACSWILGSRIPAANVAPAAIYMDGAITTITNFQSTTNSTGTTTRDSSYEVIEFY